MSRFVAAVLLLASTIVAGGCTAAEPDADDTEQGQDALVHRTRDAWFYDGPLPSLEAAQMIVSLKGHTVRVSGLLPAGAPAPAADLTYIKSKVENGRTRVDVVYPIATGSSYAYNATPGDYGFNRARPYRPDGETTSSSGTGWVTWGGFPFLAYAGNIAVHGPISRGTSATGAEIFVLQRGPVSHGCNRMLGEHVTELAHLVGVNMRKVWKIDAIYENPTTAKVKLIADYDSYDGKLVDSDYPTAGAAVRPPADRSVMFSSWVGTETPDGGDHPQSMKWEAGISGKLYVFKEHEKPNFVCSVPEARIETLRKFAETLPGAKLPAGFCAKKKCILDALKANEDPKAACSL